MAVGFRLGNATDPHGSVCFGWCCGGHRSFCGVTESVTGSGDEKPQNHAQNTRLRVHFGRLIRVIKPLTRVAKPSTGVVKPFTGVVKPSTGVVKPSTGVVKPCTGFVKPSTGVVKPCTGVGEGEGGGRRQNEKLKGSLRGQSKLSVCGGVHDVRLQQFHILKSSGLMLPKPYLMVINVPFTMRHSVPKG